MLRDDFEKAKKVLDNSSVIAFPTETVMGLGVYFDDEKAIKRLNEIKRRPPDKPYSLMLSNSSEIERYAYVDERAKKVIKTFMPGEITILLKVKENLLKAKEEAQGGIALDLIAISLKAAYDATKEILGQEITVDLEKEIFSRFCLGK